MGVLEHVPRTLEEVAPVWRWVGAGALAVTGYVIVSQVHYGLRKVRSRRQRAAFRKKNDKHKQEFAARIRKIQPGDSHEAICAMSVMALQEALQKGILKPSQVLRAYQRKAVDVNEKINCVADYILEAEEMAEKLDNATEKGSLYGIPFSVKEIHPLKGYVATFGNYTYDYVAPVTMLALQTLISQGAIPFVRSNVPYMAWSYMGLNPLYGDHGNPHDPTRNPGGSSGGQAAMVAAGATPIALGCDLAGSVRNPAAWCGIVGLKCGSTRISKKGFACDPGGLKDVLDTAYGPMARDVDSVVFMMRHLLVDQMYQADRSVPPLGWRQHIYEDRKPLRIGYFLDNGACRAVPAAERAVKIAKEKLEAAGHTLMPFDLPETDGSLGRSWLNPDMYYSLFMGDGGVHWRSDLGYDAPGRELIVPNLPFPRLPLWFNYFCGHLIKLFNEERGWCIQAMCKSSTVAKWWDHLTMLHNWRELCLAKLEKHQIDVVLSPAMSTPAMPRTLNQPNGAFASYSYVYNLLDWPAGVVPVTKVTVSDVADMKNYPSDGPVYSLIQQGMQDSDGLPVNVQIAAPPFSEELILRVLKQIEEVV